MKVTAEHRKPHKCPQGGFTRVKRERLCIWKCKKCDYTFAGGAYTPTTKLGVVAKRAAKGAPVEEETAKAAAVESVTEEETE